MLAWKTLADVQLKRPRVTEAMNGFAEAVKQASDSGCFIFPIGLPTFYEIDAITDASFHGVIDELVDNLSMGFCVAQFMELIEEELHRLYRQDFSEHTGREVSLRSAIELLGISATMLRPMVSAYVDENTFNKAFYDCLAELPFSIQLKVAREATGPKWDNSKLTSSLNDGKKFSIRMSLRILTLGKPSN